SKLAAYLMVGKPILAGVSGEGRMLLQEAEAGISFKPGDAKDLAGNATALQRKTLEERCKLGENGQRYYTNTLSFERGVSSFIKVFENIVRNNR
ncbi:MAG: putative glycosyl transferase, partial [Segetibacter sp.]|nr:putative glycosyl transferase [Segetibacter sp.]